MGVVGHLLLGSRFFPLSTAADAALRWVEVRDKSLVRVQVGTVALAEDLVARFELDMLVAWHRSRSVHRMRAVQL